MINAQRNGSKEIKKKLIKLKNGALPLPKNNKKKKKNSFACKFPFGGQVVNDEFQAAIKASGRANKKQNKKTEMFSQVKII